MTAAKRKNGRSTLPRRRASATLWGRPVAVMLVLGSTAALAQTAVPQPQTAVGRTVELDTVEVKGKAVQSATGPIDGYVATQSAAGTKTSTPLIETPQAIAVVGAQQIRDQRATSIDEATRYSPGIHSQTFGSDSRNDWFLIRGFTEQTTGYYLDGLQLYSSAFATWKLEPWNLERIEIVRGPAATLYGGGDPGGLINAVSKRPTFTTFGTVEGGVNQYGNVYGAVDLGGVAGDKGQWSYRFNSIGRIGDTQTDHTSNDRAFVAPSLTYRTGDGTTLTLLAQYQHDYTNSQNFLPYQGTVVAAPFGRIPTHLFTGDPSSDRFTRDQTMLGYEFEHIFNPNVTFRQNVRYSHLDVNFQSVYGGGYASTPTATSAELQRYNFVTRPSVDMAEADNQTEVRFNTYALQHIALFGLDLKHYDLKDTQGFVFGTPLNLLNPVYAASTPPSSRYIASNTIQDQVGLYAQDQIKLDRLTLVLSGRQDYVNTNFTNKLALASSTDSNESAFSGKVGAIYNLDFGLAPYFSYSTSFSPIVGTNTATSKPYSPEHGEQEEVGLKYQSPVLPVTASIAFFNLTRDNVLTTDPNNVLNSVQTGQQRSRGLELDATATLADGLSLIGAYTVYDLSITRDLNPANIGKLPTNTPEQFGSLWLDYTVQDGNFRGLGFGAGARYVGRSYADAANLFQVPSYLLGDAAIHYDRDHWRAALNVSNFTDETYVGSCSSTSACFYGDRRKITASLAYRW
ncbi:TonB-dependent siderophore receptor [Lichenihabitans psoromatis]|uniref:TonB-dependent siderophore receptor n=1 Tax=Lichenihabitans psoromatis TaxID=2528642 RepID=UPI0010384025|nr:TonB-dependent siderophore receptor [Lichenihabitans psoromatis]